MRTQRLDVLNRKDSIGPVVLAGSTSARASSFARHWPRNCRAIKFLPTASFLTGSQPGKFRSSPILGLGVLILLATLVRSWALDWKSHDRYRIAPVQAIGAGKPGFTRMSAQSIGVGFTNFVQEDRMMTNRNLASGSGVALGDVDGDGWCDVFICGIDATPQLYRNLGGWKFQSITATAFSGGEFAQERRGWDLTGAALADLDGDGDLDLLLNGLGQGTRLWINDGKGHFTEATDSAGIRSKSGATSMAIADVDHDGDLDVYICNFRPDTIMDRPSMKFSVRNVSGRPVVVSVNGRPTSEVDLTNRFELGPDGRVLEFGEPDVLWINDGHGHFTAASWTDGTFLDEEGKPWVRAPHDWGLAAHLGDLDGDGWPDLYVCNDLHTPDRLWMNQSSPGRLQFRAIRRTALRSNSTFSMGVDFGDLNRDGFTDLFTVDMLGRKREDRARQLAGMSPSFRAPGEQEDRIQLQRNALQINRGDNTFAETGIFSGVEASDWSWGPIFLDVDLDGYEDILITNGQWRDYQDSDGAARIAQAQSGGRTLAATEIAQLIQGLPGFATAHVAFHNQTGIRIRERGGQGGAGLVPIFKDAAPQWGFDSVGISQGAALADLDNDGDLDLVMNNLLDAPGFYRNDSPAPRVAVRVRGAGLNSQGIGARITVRIPASQDVGFPLQQSQEVISASRYLSGDEAVRTFATGGQSAVDLEVRWPSGKVDLVQQVPANSWVEVLETPAAAPARSVASPTPGLRFRDVSALLGHTHVEEAFDDFARQPLLPYRLAQLGPGVTWTDLNQDGFPDLIVGSGRSGRLAVFENNQKGGFQKSSVPAFQRVLGRDTTTILPLRNALLVGSSNWEDGQTNGGAMRIYDLESQRSGEVVLGVDFSVGPLAAADVDGSGDLQVFVGGRARAGRWPETVPSLLLKNREGRFEVARRLEGFGRVTGACFTDWNGDGRPDLVASQEWGPLKMLQNQGGDLVETNPVVWVGNSRLRLGDLSGLWNSVTAGDFDGDGRLDLIAGNWGWNSILSSAQVPELRPSLVADRAVPAPFRRLYFGDFGSGAGMDVLEALPESSGEWPGREYPVWARVLPGIRSAAPTHAAFAASTVSKLLGATLSAERRLDLTWTASTIFLNRDDHWEAHALPDMAQLSPVFGLAVADADGDGNEDVFLAQNWFATDPVTPRQDAGRGLWLMGNGKGGFQPSLLSGVEAYGEQRGASVADYDADGRPDLVVAQNAGRTLLYHNETGKPGLRVTLLGESNNPTAVGAAVRLVFANHSGSWREIHLGSGYWSVDHTTLVLAKPTVPLALEVRWPGGKRTRNSLPESATSVVVRADGSLTQQP